MTESLLLGFALGVILGYLFCQFSGRWTERWLIRGASLYRDGALKMAPERQSIKAIQNIPDDLNIEQSEAFAQFEREKMQDQIRKEKERLKDLHGKYAPIDRG